MNTLCEFHCFFLDYIGYPWKKLVLIPRNLAPSRERIYETTRRIYLVLWKMAENPTRENTTHEHEKNKIYYSWKHIHCENYQFPTRELPWRLNFNPWKISKNTGENFCLPFYLLESLRKSTRKNFSYPWTFTRKKKKTHFFIFFFPAFGKKKYTQFWDLIEWMGNELFRKKKKYGTFGLLHKKYVIYDANCFHAPLKSF